MSNVFIEYKKKRSEFVATQNNREIANGATQKDTIDDARRRRATPEDPMLAERQRLRSGKPHPDKWRRVY